MKDDFYVVEDGEAKDWWQSRNAYALMFLPVAALIAFWLCACIISQ